MHACSLILKRSLYDHGIMLLVAGASDLFIYLL